MPALAPFSYNKVSTGGNTQPPPGGLGITAFSDISVRIAISKIDADGNAHAFSGAQPGGVLVVQDSTGTKWNVILVAPVTDADYYLNTYGDVANANALAATSGVLVVYLPYETTNPSGLWVTGDEILQHVRVAAPKPDDVSWADECASAVSHGIDNYLGVQPDPLPVGMYEEVRANALTAGGDAYRRRDAPFGMAGYSDVSGISERVARDYLNGIYPQLDRWRSIGIA